MRQRWLKRLGLGIGLLLLAVVGLWLLITRPGVTWWNYEQIDVGMTRPEVERLLGGPGREPRLWAFAGQHWRRDDGFIIEVMFDQEDRVIIKSLRDHREAGFSDKIRRWLGL